MAKEIGICQLLMLLKWGSSEIKGFLHVNTGQGVSMNKNQIGVKFDKLFLIFANFWR